jgi:hypothetical protein
MRRAAVFKWWKRFRDRETNVKDEPRSGRLSTAPVPLSSWSLRQTVCSTFSRSVWSAVRSASLAKGGTSKKRPSPRLHKVPTRNNKVSLRVFQTALVYNRQRVPLKATCLETVVIKTRNIKMNFYSGSPVHRQKYAKITFYISQARILRESKKKATILPLSYQRSVRTHRRKRT